MRVSMKRITTLLCTLTLIAAGAALIAPRRGVAQGVYTVTDVRLGLRRSPHAWIGRTILIHGTITGLRYTLAQGLPKGAPLLSAPIPLANMLSTQTAIPAGFVADVTLDPSSALSPTHPSLPTGPTLSFVLSAQPHLSTRVLNVLRALPLLGPTLPAPATLYLFAPATYHVRLTRRFCPTYRVHQCFDGLLLVP